MTSRLAPLLALAVLVVACVREEKPVTEPVSLQSIRVAPRAPSPGKPPLLVLLHGIGSNERDLVSLAPHLDPRFDVRSVRAPNPMGPDGYAWFASTPAPDGSRRIDPAQAESSRRTILRFIDEAVAADGADPQRVYLAGFSQGGIMAMSVALTAPERVAGAVAMSGRILQEIEPIRASPEALAGLPLLVVHGTFDQVLPIAHGHASRDLLSQLPVDLTYRELPMAHTITGESLGIVSDWLTRRLAQPRRSTTP